MTTRDQKAFKFFREHAGYGYDPTTETPEQGRDRGARKLAAAERYAFENEWTHEWRIDESGCNCDTDTPCEKTSVCVLYDTNANIIASLSGICDPTAEYRRVIEAELAMEAMPTAESVEV